MTGKFGVIARVTPRTLRALTGGDDLEAALVGLGDALRSSRAWASLSQAVIAVRSTPQPLLAVLGEMNATEMARLEALEVQLRRVERAFRFVDYPDAQQAVDRLATELHNRFGRKALTTFTFRAVPRGGHIVLAMLAYALDLRPEQLTEQAQPGVPVVVVDDCSLSGARCRSVLDSLPAEQPVVFAHLYSVPALRDAIAAAEPRVVACLAAHDLGDLAPDLHGVDYLDWRSHWSRRNPADYWTGDPEPICFAWNEPDVNVWNPVTGVAEAGWRLVPPERCRKNIVRHGPHVQIVRFASGPVAPAPDVVSAVVGDDVVIAQASTRRALRLPGVAGQMWQALTATGELTDAVDLLAERYAVGRERLSSDLDGLIGTLCAAGVLERAQQWADDATA